MNYQWLPDTEGAWQKRVSLAINLEADANVLERIWEQMPACKCLNVLAVTIDQYRKWARELRDRRRRKVPMVGIHEKMPWFELVKE